MKHVDKEQKRKRAEERKRKKIENLIPKLAEQKTRWEREQAEKSANGKYVTDGSLTREEINIKILDKVFKAYEAFDGEDYGLYSLLNDMLHDTHNDPCKRVVFKWKQHMNYRGGATKELLKEIVDEFDIPSYEETEKRENEAAAQREREQDEVLFKENMRRKHEWAEYEARREREREERERKQVEKRKRELVRKSAEQKAHWERILARKSAHDDDLADGRLTREEINIKILDKLSKAYEKSGGKDSDLEFLISSMLPPWSDDPYKKVAYELRYSLGDKKQYLKEIAVEFDIPSYEEIEAREKEEEERERREELNRKLDEQKLRWERERNKKLTQSKYLADGRLTREEINIKILDKIFKAYESSGGESYGLNSLLDDMLDLTHRDPYEWIAYKLTYSSGDTKELLKEIVDEFEIPSYEEIEKRKREEREREWAAEEARWEREEMAGGIVNAIGAIFGFFIGFFLTILFKNPPKNNSQ